MAGQSGWKIAVSSPVCVPAVLWVFFLSPLLEPGKHKHRKCERPLSAQLSKPVIVRPGSKRYDFPHAALHVGPERQSSFTSNAPPFLLLTHPLSLSVDSS